MVQSRAGDYLLDTISECLPLPLSHYQIISHLDNLSQQGKLLVIMFHHLWPGRVVTGRRQNLMVISSLNLGHSLSLAAPRRYISWSFVSPVIGLTPLLLD